MVELPPSLVERSKRRQTALVSGLGCSELAGAPGWAALVEWLAARLPNDADRVAAQSLAGSGRLGDAVALVRAGLGPAGVPDALREAYPDGAPVPDVVVQATGLPWRAVATTAFDDLWERALTTSDEGQPPKPPQILLGTDRGMRAPTNGPGPPLVHLFGRADVAGSVCLGLADAHEPLTPARGLAWLAELRQRRSLVLVGFRAGDPDLGWLASWMSLLPPPELPHYLFLDVSRDADPAAEARLVALRTGLNVIPCSGGTAEALETLAELARDIGAQVAGDDADVDLAEWLAKWARDPADPEPREVLARAEAALRQEQEWDRLIALLLRRFELQEDRNEQLAALDEAAAIFRGPLALPERALSTGLAALRLSPFDDALWESLRADAAAAGAWEELAEDASEVAAALGTHPGAARVWREVARVAMLHLDRTDLAVTALEAALAVAPDDQTRDELAELLRKQERWTELVAALVGAAAETKDTARGVALLLEAAEVLEGWLDDADGATATYEAALALDPDSERAAAALESLYEHGQRWAELASLLDKPRRSDGAGTAASRHRRRAELLATHLGEGEKAAEELEALVAADPTDRASLRLLLAIYEKADRQEEVLRTVQRLADTAGDDAERLSHLRRLAPLWEAREGGLDKAADALEHILRLEPGDLEAFAVLTNVYRAANRPVALADVLARQIERTESGDARTALLVTLAQTYDQGLDDREKAYAAYQAAEQDGDHREETYEALVRLAERLQRWEACADWLLKWASVAPETAVQAEVLVQAALLFEQQLGDKERAEAQLTRVLGIAPDHTQAKVALARLSQQTGAYARAVELFLDAQQGAPDGFEKAALLTEAAKILQDHLGEEDRAAQVYAAALSADGEHVAAGERLAEILFGRKQWSEVEPILDMLVRKLDPASAAPLAAAQHRLAQVADEQGQGEKAAAAYAEAHRLAPESLAVLTDAARFRYRRGEWSEARDLHAALLRLHRSALPAADVLAMTMRLAECEAELGDVAAAIEWYDRARAQDPAHRPAIEASMALHERRHDWLAVVKDKRALMALAGPGEPAQLWEDVGDVYADKLAEPVQGEAAYRSALQAEPGRRSALHKLLDLYSKEKNWRQAADTLVNLAEVDSDGAVRAKSLFAAALIRRDELGHATEAAELLEQALDHEPTMPQAFDALVKLHGDANDWQEQARSYRRMIRRLPTEGLVELRLRLWTELGELAMRRLHNRELSVTAYEVAASLAPEDSRRQEQLADMYLNGGAPLRDKAIAAHQHLVARNPNRLASYRALAKVYAEARQFDKHWCVAATLSFLGKADATLESTYQRHRPPQLRVTRRRFNEEVWQRVAHPDEDRLVAALFGLAGSYLAAPAARPHAAVGLRRRKRVELATDTRVPVRALALVAEMLDLPAPDLFVVETGGAETALLNLQEKGVATPALVLGAPTLQRRDDFELVFELTKRMAILRPERFLRVALGTPEALDLALRVALALGGSPIGPGPHKGEVDRLTTYLRRTVPPQVIEQLELVASRFVAAHPEPVDFQKWIIATELGAARAGLVVTGDVAAAARVIGSEPTASTLPVKDRLKDLIAFSVSEDYFACRRLLGLEIG